MPVNTFAPVYSAGLEEKGSFAMACEQLGLKGIQNLASALVIETGYIGSRIVWVKLGGLLVDIFVIGVYIPHTARKAEPFQ